VVRLHGQPDDPAEAFILAPGAARELGELLVKVTS
jgi:hypothetical protein